MTKPPTANRQYDKPKFLLCRCPRGLFGYSSLQFSVKKNTFHFGGPDFATPVGKKVKCGPLAKNRQKIANDETANRQYDKPKFYFVVALEGYSDILAVSF